MEFQNAKENVSHGFGNLVIWLWKSFRNVIKLVCTNLDTKLIFKNDTWGSNITYLPRGHPITTQKNIQINGSSMAYSKSIFSPEDP